MTTNNTIQNIKYNKITEIQGELITMLTKKKKIKHTKNIFIIKQQESDYVRFELDVLTLLL